MQLGNDDDGNVGLFALILLVFVVGSLLGRCSAPAQAHSFYSKECCHDNDCAPVTRVENADNGRWMTTIHGRVFVPWGFKPVYPAPDGALHLCVVRPATGVAPRCIYDGAGY